MRRTEVDPNVHKTAKLCKTLREEANIDQAEAAALIGATQKWISNLETLGAGCEKHKQIEELIAKLRAAKKKKRRK